MQDVQSAKEDGGQHAGVRPPDGEDDQGDGQPPSVAEGVVGPDAVGVVQHVVEAAEARDHAAHAGGHVLVLDHVDAGGVRRSGAFTDSPQMQARTGALEDVGGHQGDDDGQVHQKAVGQEHLTEPAKLIRKGQACLDIAAGAAQYDGGDLRVGELDQRAAEEVAEAHAEGGDGKAGHVLVGPEGDGEEAVEEARQ